MTVHICASGFLKKMKDKVVFLQNCICFSIQTDENTWYDNLYIYKTGYFSNVNFPKWRGKYGKIQLAKRI